MRERYFLFVSVMYLLLGGLLVARSLSAQLIPAGLLGIVLVALGAVRLKDYFRHRKHST
jgi:uncharacterized membrane protein HdeD (DUF308 family)